MGMAAPGEPSWVLRRSQMRRRGTRWLERTVLGLVMATAAGMLERRLLKVVARKEVQT
jgi:hypothetical protein